MFLTRLSSWNFIGLVWLWRKLIFILMIAESNIWSLALNTGLFIVAQWSLNRGHSIGDLLLKFHLNSPLIIGIENMHGLKVQSAHSSHKSFLQIFLHHRLVSMLILHYHIRFVKFFAERLDLFVVLCAYMLKLKLDSFLEGLSILDYFPSFVLLLPALESLAGHILLKLACSML